MVELDPFDEKKFNFFDPFKTKGRIALLCKNPFFERLTFLVIVIHAFYMGIEAEHNHADLVSAAPLHFQIAENVFTSLAKSSRESTVRR